MSWLFSVFLKKFILLGYSMFVAACNWLVWRFMPNCKLKTILLRRY